MISESPIWIIRSDIESDIQIKYPNSYPISEKTSGYPKIISESLSDFSRPVSRTGNIRTIYIPNCCCPASDACVCVSGPRVSFHNVWPPVLAMATANFRSCGRVHHVLQLTPAGLNCALNYS